MIPRHWDFKLNAGGIIGGVIGCLFSGFAIYKNIAPEDLSRLGMGKVIILAIVFFAFAGNVVWRSIIPHNSQE